MPAATRHDADDLLIVALAGGKTHKDAAESAGVSVRTVRRRLADPAFKAEVQQARAALVSDAAGRLTSGMTAAVIQLQKLLFHDDPVIQLRAAVKAIELGVRLHEVTDLEKRLSELEQQTGGQRGEH